MKPDASIWVFIGIVVFSVASCSMWVMDGPGTESQRDLSKKLKEHERDGYGR